MTLNISVLGSVRVNLHGNPIENFYFARVCALLVYLAIEDQETHDRNFINTLLWPDAEPQIASSNFRQALSKLRLIVEDKKQSRDKPYILASAKTIGINRETDLFVDLKVFQKLTNEVQKHKHRRLGVCPGCIEKLEQAVSLYEGDFLSEFTIDSEPFEDWVRSKREPLHILVLNCLQELTDYHYRHNNLSKSLSFAYKQIKLDPFCDIAHHQLIQIFVAMGMRNAALSHYETYRKNLGTRLQVHPLAETVNLYKQIVAGQLGTHNLPGTPPCQLPTQLLPTIGYETEIRRIREKLASLDCRLITVTGLGGCGKTHLSTHVGWQERLNFRDGIYFVDLTQVKAKDLLAAIGNALPLPSTPHQDIKTQLFNWLRDREVLLILDHFDHLINQAAVLLKLLTVTHHAKILITSRQWLKLRGEHVISIYSLSYPTSSQGLSSFETYEAVQLFMESAYRIKPDFIVNTVEDKSAVAKICRIVGGNPLAIQLAAYWVTIFSVTEIAERIALNVDFLSTPLNHLPPRQRSMAAVFLACWNRLNQQERHAFCRLSIFSGSFNLEAAEKVAQAKPQIIFSLQSKSLLKLVNGGADEKTLFSTKRFIIPEPYRYYGNINLHNQSNLAQQIQFSLHSKYFLDLLHLMIRKLNDHNRHQILKDLYADLENFEQAWQWAINQQQYNRIARSQHDLSFLYTELGAFEKAKFVIEQAVDNLSNAIIEASELQSVPEEQSLVMA